MKKCAIVFCLLGLLILPGISSAQLPSSFDLRNYSGQNYVTSVKSQQGGTCWTHGAMASMESNLMMTAVWAANGEYGEPNLAEYHLDWWNGFNENNNDDIIPPDGSGLIVHEGGDYRVTTAYLSRGEGAVRDIDGQSFDTPPYRDDPSYHYYYPRDVEWYTAGEVIENIDTIKVKLMEYGAIGTALLYSGEFINANYTHYQPPSNPDEPNHAVTIVGWDDNKATQAPLPGAWLIKNSWGEYWGFDGYFWISYYDKCCGHHPEMGAVSFQNIERMQYDNVYYHDYHGWRDTRELTSEAFNAFTAQDDEWLESVSFFTAADNVDYTITVYGNFINYQLSGEIHTQSGFIQHSGFHTIDLDSPVILETGLPFYIYVSFSDGGHPYDRTSDIPVLLGANYRTIVESDSKPGESFYREGGEWYDLNDYNSSANFCIKGLANPRSKALGMACLTDIPHYLPLNVPCTLTVEITDAVETYKSETATMFYRFADGDYQSLPLASLGGNQFRAVLPAGDCTDVPEFYFSAEGDVGTIVHYPANAPAVVLTAVFDNYTPVFVDDFEIDNGWMVSGSASAGHWEIGVPVGGGDRGDPPADFDGSGQCYLTGNADGDSDVDNGYSFLESPMINLLGIDAQVHYAVWYSNNASGDPNNDVFRVWVSGNMGIDYELVDTIGPVSIDRWKEHTFKVSDYVTPSEYVRFKFEVSDIGGASIVEAGLDDFQIYTLDCGSRPRGDANGDYAINVADAVYVINYTFKGGPEPSPMSMGDANCDGPCDVGDAVYLINYVFKGGPEPGCF